MSLADEKHLDCVNFPKEVTMLYENENGLAGRSQAIFECVCACSSKIFASFYCVDFCSGAL